MRAVSVYLNKFKCALTEFGQCERGLALIEFAFSVAILMLLLFGGIEVSRYVLIFQKLQITVNNESNLITAIDPQHDPAMTKSEMDSIITAAKIMMAPYALDTTNSTLILTDIYAPVTSGLGNNPGSPVVKWRYCGPGTLGTSKLGAVGKAATLKSLPNNFTMSEGDEIVAAELYYKFNPIVKNGITSKVVPFDKTVYNVAISVPRYSSLVSLLTTAGGSNCK
ncbi:MAG TPA: TadE family protein [Rickettsiales bacterium]|nr:TadE family protein [Rickettsiales bacterium]